MPSSAFPQGMGKKQWTNHLEKDSDWLFGEAVQMGGSEGVTPPSEGSKSQNKESQVVAVPTLCQQGSPTFSGQKNLLTAHCLNWRMLELQQLRSSFMWQPCPWQQGWKQVIFKDPSKPCCDSVILCKGRLKLMPGTALQVNLSMDTQQDESNPVIRRGNCRNQLGLGKGGKNPSKPGKKITCWIESCLSVMAV